MEVKLLRDWEDEPSAALMTCTECKATVEPRNYPDHMEWHRKLNRDILPTIKVG